MFNLKSFTFILIAVVVLSNSTVQAHMHTHIGLNADGIQGNADDNQLWFFVTPDNPSPILEMTPTGDYIGGKQVYVAVLDCWHSAHPDNGAFQLDFNDQSTAPDWKMNLQRVSFSDPVNFWMEDEATAQEVLSNDGDTLYLGDPMWGDELPNGQGGTGAWHLHKHTEFFVLANGIGETFSATFKAIDTGSTNFSDSEDFTMNFVTVPEPATLSLLGFGLISLVRRRK